MSDLPQGQNPSHQPMDESGQDEALEQLFAERLPAAPLSAAVAERLAQQVQSEVRRVYPPRRPAAPAKPNRFDRFRAWAGSLRPAQSLALAGATALAILLLFVGIARLMPRPLTAHAQVAAGDAMVLREHNGSFRIFHDGDILRLQKGDQIITEGAVVTITHFPDQVAIIEPGAHVELAELDEADGGTQVEMYVHDGAVRSSIDAPLDANDRFVVRAPNVEVSAHGTEFRVETITEDEALVTTVEGEVEVQTEGQRVEVAAGEALNVADGEPLVVAPVAVEGEHRRPLLLVALAIGRLLKIHAAPDNASAIVGEVTADLTFAVEEQDASGEWYRVCCVAGKGGWVHLPRLDPSR